MLESEEKYRMIIENMQDIYFRTDLKKNLTTINPAGVTFSGVISSTDLIGRPLDPSYFSNIQDLELFHTLISEKKIVDNYPITLIRGDGSFLYGVVNARYCSDKKGEIVGIEGTVHDITDRKRAEDALRQANRQLNLLSGITRHDILNKVTVLQALIDLAKMEISEDLILPYLTNMESVTEIIQSQIEFTRVYEYLGSTKPQWSDLITIIHALPGMESITVLGDIQGTEVFADPMLEKVFFNLLDNFIQHSQTGNSIRVSCDRRGDELAVVWEDNGIGIPIEEKEMIFTQGYGKNTGFGLFLAREILSITDITIHETGVPGDGARFEILVPKNGWRIRD